MKQEVDRLRGERNVVANKMKGKLELSDRQALIEQGKNLKEQLTALEDLVQLTDKLQQEAQCIPNITHPDLPIGGEDCSVLRKKVGSLPAFNFSIKDHLQLGKELDLFDFDGAAEISSASYCTDYQSRRLGIRYRPSPSNEAQTSAKKGKASQASTRFVHTLNATACAVPRMIVCLLENFQQDNGSVIIPKSLRPFMGGLDIIHPKLK